MKMRGRTATEWQAIHMAEHSGVVLTPQQLATYVKLRETPQVCQPGEESSVSDSALFSRMLRLTSQPSVFTSEYLASLSAVRALPERSTTSRDMGAVLEVHLETGEIPTLVVLR
jgi:hypothetical protein